MNESALVALPRVFFEPSASVVGPELLGHWLVRRTRHGLCGGPIVETEAYLWNDPACHAAAGMRPRNRVMFGPPGHAYVYFIYGAHYCVNAVCRPAGTGEAVLIRAVEAEWGQVILKRNRRARSVRELTNGPAKLCQAMGIDRKLDGADLCDAGSPLFVAQNPEIDQFRVGRGQTVTTTRIGITKAADLPLRFYLEQSPFVSGLRRG
ncbi:MAG TPA: DNA-3-methyladenine glycosylase [Verrucomicrobiae bacterium]